MDGRKERACAWRDARARARTPHTTQALQGWQVAGLGQRATEISGLIDQRASTSITHALGGGSSGSSSRWATQKAREQRGQPCAGVFTPGSQCSLHPSKA